MITFKSFILERKVDPVELASRVARRYGKKTNYGKWLKAEKHQNIPLSSYNRKEVDSLERKHESYHKKIGTFDRKRSEEALKTQKEHLSTEKMKIKDLHATQPFNRVEDKSKLSLKVNDHNPTHVHVVTHKGKHYVADGHHAVMAAHLRGDKEIMVNHLNLDNH